MHLPLWLKRDDASNLVYCGSLSNAQLTRPTLTRRQLDSPFPYFLVLMLKSHSQEITKYQAITTTPMTIRTVTLIATDATSKAATGVVISLVF